MIHRTDSSWQPNIDEIDHENLIISDKGSTKNDFKESRQENMPVSLHSPHLHKPQLWQQHLQQAITDPSELLTLLDIDASYTDAAIAASRLFPTKVPRTLLNRIEKGNINDPILQQVLPLTAELENSAGYSVDPVGEQTGQAKGIIHKYHGRVLLMVNGHCAVNCRYCFRRHYPYDDNRLSRLEWQDVLQSIQQDTSISEVIYSGGDPLASSDRQLRWLSQQFAHIPHITRLRIHTRLPIVIPQRITESALQWMTETRLSTVIVLHANHPNELNDKELNQAIKKMTAAGITVLNQAVLLKGINDHIETLTNLSELLFSSGVLPYYLHVLDKVQGAAHFDIDEAHAKQLHTQLTHRLPGYLVPKLVREIANEPSKTNL